MCPSIGPTLRSARTGLGLTLQDAAHKTRISVPRLRALEQDDFASFGNPVYARSFLKLYSDYLRIDATETLEWLCLNPPESAPPRSGSGRISVTADLAPPVRAGYSLWTGAAGGDGVVKTSRAPSPLPAALATGLMLIAAVGLWISFLAQDGRQRALADREGVPPGMEQSAAHGDMAAGSHARPPGRREPKQIIAKTSPPRGAVSALSN